MLVDEEVFQDDYQPQRLVHRDAEQQQLSRAFEPALHGERARDVLIWGPQGVGKSALTQHVLDQLDRRVDIACSTVHCLGKSTTGIIRSVLHSLGVPVAENSPEFDLVVRLQDRVNEPTIVVLDEGDSLPTTDALERLWDIPLVSVAPICHDRDRWLDRLDYTTRRQLHDAVDLHLTRYSPSELADILEPRADHGLRRGSAGRKQLEHIADETAGSARWAITSLHAAATIAEERGHDTIRDQHIPQAVERGQRWIRERQLQSLDVHHHLIYEILRACGPLAGSELHARYDSVVPEAYHGQPATPICKRARRYKLDKLSDYGLIDNEGRYRVVDDDVESPLEFKSVPERV